jgi:hypothetical protein
MVCASPQFTGPPCMSSEPVKSTRISSPATSTRTRTQQGSSVMPLSSRQPSAVYVPSGMAATASRSKRSVCAKIASRAASTVSSPCRSMIAPSRVAPVLMQAICAPRSPTAG